MHITSPPILPLATSAPAGTETGRVLFAFSREERELFLPEGLPADTEARAHRWLAPQEEPEGRWEELLRAWRPDAVVACWTTPPLPLSLLDQAAPRYVCHLAGSIRHAVPRPFLERGLLVSNWGGLAANQVAEHALLLVLASLRNLGRWDHAWSEGKGYWPLYWKGMRTRTLEGRRVGLHGFGRVARRLLELMRPFGVEVRAWSEGVPERLMREHGAVPAASLEALFAESDVLVECEALTPRSRRSVTEAVLRRLPEGACFVNVGRGEVVDEAALAAVGAERRLRVACDVFAVEPLPPESPLWDIPGVLLSPHIAGPTHDRFPACGAFALRNLDLVFRGEAPEALVDLAAYDRAT